VKTYLVAWEIVIFAADPREAARKAVAVWQDPSPNARTFHVRGEDGVYS